MKRLALLPLLLFVFACADTPTELAQNTGDLVMASAPAPATPILAKATGSGHLFTGVDPQLRTFAFTAKLFEDGSAQGNWEIVNREQGTANHYKVACLEVHGNEAWVGGYVSKSANFEEGTAAAFRVVDNGEGAKASGPDQIMLTILWGTSGYTLEQVCADLWYFATALDLLDIVKGNVQVN